MKYFWDYEFKSWFYPNYDRLAPFSGVFFSLSTPDHLSSVIARLHIIVSLSLGHSQAPRDKRRTPVMTLNHTPFICGNDIKN